MTQPEASILFLEQPTEKSVSKPSAHKMHLTTIETIHCIQDAKERTEVTVSV